MDITAQTLAYIAKQDEKLNAKEGYNQPTPLRIAAPFRAPARRKAGRKAA